MPAMSERRRLQNFTNRLLDAGRAPFNGVGKVNSVNSVKTEPSKPASALPLKTVAEELAFLRKSFRDLATAYAGQIEAEITRLHGAVIAEAESKRKLPASRAHDLRDMLMLLRSLEIKPAKGKRRDLKKVENLVEELRMIADRWE
jgi:hypothetical protein